MIIFVFNLSWISYIWLIFNIFTVLYFSLSFLYYEAQKLKQSLICLIIWTNFERLFSGEIWKTFLGSRRGLYFPRNLLLWVQWGRCALLTQGRVKGRILSYFTSFLSNDFFPSSVSFYIFVISWHLSQYVSDGRTVTKERPRIWKRHKKSVSFEHVQFELWQFFSQIFNICVSFQKAELQLSLSCETTSLIIDDFPPPP